MSLQPVSTTSKNARLAGIIWGPAKTGKTTFAATLPGKKLIINFDPDGYLSIMHRTDVDFIDLAELPAKDAINEAKKAADFIVSEEGEQYGSVILDSLTTLTETSLRDAIDRGIGRSAGFTPSIDAPGIAGYGARNSTTNDVLSRILRATGRAGKNVFFIAHADDPIQNEVGQAIQQTIMLASKIRNLATLKVSEIYYIDTGTGGKRTLYLAPFGIKSPMGSRIFDTAACPKFELKYTIDEDDETQPDTLANIINTWRENGYKKLTSRPTEISKVATKD